MVVAMLSLLALVGYPVLRMELFFFGMGRWSALFAGALIILLFVDNVPAMFSQVRTSPLRSPQHTISCIENL
jgi:hypothetical protein